MVTIMMCVISPTLSVMDNGTIAKEDVQIQGPCPVLLLTAHQPQNSLWFNSGYAKLLLSLPPTLLCCAAFQCMLGGSE